MLGSAVGRNLPDGQADPDGGMATTWNTSARRPSANPADDRVGGTPSFVDVPRGRRLGRPGFHGGAAPPPFGRKCRLYLRRGLHGAPPSATALADRERLQSFFQKFRVGKGVTGVRVSGTDSGLAGRQVVGVARTYAVPIALR